LDYLTKQAIKAIKAIKAIMQNLNLKYNVEKNDMGETYLNFPSQRILIDTVNISSPTFVPVPVPSMTLTKSTGSSAYYNEMSVLFRKWNVTKPTYKQFRIQYPMLRTLTNALLKQLMTEHTYESYQDKWGSHFENWQVPIHTYAEFRKQYPAVKNFPNEQLQNYMEVANYKVYRACRECN